MALRRPLIKNKEKRNRIIHIISATMIFIHAYEKYESGHGSYIWFAIAGGVFLTIALLHPILEKKLPWVDGGFFVIEGILSLIVAADFFHMGKKALPYSYVFTALIQFMVAFFTSRKAVKHHHANARLQQGKP